MSYEVQYVSSPSCVPSLLSMLEELRINSNTCTVLQTPNERNALLSHSSAGKKDELVQDESMSTMTSTKIALSTITSSKRMR